MINRKLICTFLIVLSLTLASSPVEAQLLERFGFGKKSDSGLSESKITDGLKEALRVGAEKVVKITSKKDGYFKNEKIKIPLPDKVQSMARALRTVGFGDQVDEFILSMNRAAEKAAPAAKKIFVDAIAKMTIEDAKAIWKGSDTAATDYFKKTTTKPLTKAFTPTVEKAMKEYAVTAKYKTITDRYDNIPFAKNYPAPDIEAYTVQKALDGLFYMLAEQERQIRTKPAARVTDLLKEVFAGDK